MDPATPTRVRTGIKLLGITCAWTGFVACWMLFGPQSYLNVMLPPPQLSAPGVGPGGPGGPGVQPDTWVGQPAELIALLPMTGVVLLAASGISIWLLTKLAQGRHWARVTLTVLVVLDLAHGLFAQFSLMTGTARLVGLANLALLGIGLVLVWQRNGPAPRPIPESRLTSSDHGST